MTELAIPQQTAIQPVTQVLGNIANVNSVIGILKSHGHSVEEVNEAMYKLFMCEKAAGLLLEEIAPHGGSKIDTIKLENMGIKAWQSARWRKVAQIHEEDIRVYCNESDDAVTRSGILKLQTMTTTPPPTRNTSYYRKKVLQYAKLFLRTEGGKSEEYGYAALFIDDMEKEDA